MALFTIATSAHSMSYEQARAQALFLTDKMAYELNLTEEQYEAAFENKLRLPDEHKQCRRPLWCILET